MSDNDDGRDRMVADEYDAWHEKAHGIGRLIYAMGAVAVTLWALVAFARWVA